MSNVFADTLHCSVRVSAWQLAFNRYVHALALAVTLAVALYRPAFLLLTIAIGVSYVVELRRARLGTRKSVHVMRWQADGNWVWQRRDGVSVRGTLTGATVLGRHAVILRLLPEGRRMVATPVFLPADSLAPDTHRRLRARLTMWYPASRTARSHAQP